MAENTTLGVLRRVELFEDRAAVRRELPLPAEGGRVTLRVGPLSPLIREEALALIEQVGVELESMEVTRELLTPEDADPERVAALRERRDSLERAGRASSAGRARARDVSARADKVVRSAREWAHQALLQAEDVEAWAGELAALEDRSVSLELQRLRAELDTESEQHELVFAERALVLARGGRHRRRAFLEIKLLLQPNCAPLTLSYSLPCALWRPVHEAALQGETLRWQLGAMAWNATGEDWEGAELVFSTERPGDSPSPPELSSDVLIARRRGETIEVEAREESVQVARQGQTKASQEMMGVDDGGEVRVYVAPGQPRLPSTGRPVHVPLSAWSSPASLSWLACPELSGLAILRSRQPNAGSAPLLAGPVVLRRDGGHVGRAQVKLIPPGEPFDLGWGSHDDLVLTRRQEQESSTTRITGTQRREFKVFIRVCNLGDEALTLEVKERLPVSELKEVEVSAPKASPALESGPDKDGFVLWRLALKPGADEALELSYSVEASSKVRLPW
ncbi:MAG: mucoidy inhibitor MuiA family protein [Alphaproteobacteria bacterium]|nr:mucoidy inhibitor MuiA family protein [Alphaproteobacteria bacterium]MCB9793955.1 mucoidy inhibitor MuiA family protein [Alphaproteobacteria bacterium]